MTSPAASGRFRATLNDSARLFSLSVFQKVLATCIGFLYLFVLSPAAYAAWKSLSALFQIAIPGWTFLQSDFARRRALGDSSWVSAWKGMMILSVGFGLVAIGIVYLARTSLLRLYPSAAPFSGLLTIGSMLFLTSALKTCFSLWWQVTDRFMIYTRIQFLEQGCYLALLLIGFFVLRFGVVAIPAALVATHLISLVTSLFLWLSVSQNVSHTTTFSPRHIASVFQLLKGEGGWTVLRESSWDWYEAGKVAILNAIFPATILGLIFAAETLTSYVTSLLSVIQPALQVRMAAVLDREKAAAAFRRGIRLLVLAAWCLYLISIPGIYLLVHFIFVKYELAWPLYPWFALQLPWAAIAVVLTPYLFTFPIQRTLFLLSVERYIVELAVLGIGYLVLGAEPAIVIAAHLAAGYLFLFHRMSEARRFGGMKLRLLRSIFPEHEATSDARFVLQAYFRQR